MNTKVIEIKTDKKSIFFTIQIIAVLVMLIFGIVAIFEKSYEGVFFLILSLNMIILTINNFLFLKRKYIWILYIALAIYTFIQFLLRVL